tara:strand:+ start:100 stop:309 length:210 start_codon:yes stop_codon:yes gene_type:complete
MSPTLNKSTGNVSDPEQINEIIASEKADLCCMAKGQLYNPYFAHHSARALEVENYSWPKQYAAAPFYKS